MLTCRFIKSICHFVMLTCRFVMWNCRKIQMFYLRCLLTNPIFYDGGSIVAPDGIVDVANVLMISVLFDTIISAVGA